MNEEKTSKQDTKKKWHLVFEHDGKTALGQMSLRLDCTRQKRIYGSLKSASDALEAYRMGRGYHAYLFAKEKGWRGRVEPL